MSDVSESIQWTPLHAEAREKYSHWYNPELNPGCEGRAKFLYEQLKARPSPWGRGLWKDEETEKIAERCASLLQCISSLQRIGDGFLRGLGTGGSGHSDRAFNCRRIRIVHCGRCSNCSV